MQYHFRTVQRNLPFSRRQHPHKRHRWIVFRGNAGIRNPALVAPNVNTLCDTHFADPFSFSA
jgi:hypothetical protein